MLAKAAFLSFFLTLVGFILLLLVTLSAPIVDDIAILKIKYPNQDTAANIGVLGICYEFDDSYVPTFPRPRFSSYCTKPKVAYDFEARFFGLNIGSEVNRTVVKGLAGSLILNPICAGLAGISLFFALFAWLCASRFMEIVLFITLFLSAFVAWLSFWLDLALALVGRNRINNYTNGTFSGHIGNAVWLAFGGALALSAAICLAGCGVFGRYSDRHVNRNLNTAPSAPLAEKPAGRRRFWQRSQASPGTY